MLLQAHPVTEVRMNLCLVEALLAAHVQEDGHLVSMLHADLPVHPPALQWQLHERLELCFSDANYLPRLLPSGAGLGRRGREAGPVLC